MLKVYLGQGMTGFDRKEMRAIALSARKAFRKYGIDTWSPVLEERVPNKKGLLTNSKDTLNWKWPLDAVALKKECWVMVVLTGDVKSFGCESEYALMRGCEWQPVVLVSPKHAGGYVSIRNYMDDAVVGTVEEAAELVSRRWGSWPKRVLWKLWVLTHLPKWLFRQVRRLFQ